MASQPDTSNAVFYHYGAFPPNNIDTSKLLQPLAEAARSLSRYDAMLDQLHNSSFLLGPIRRQEAIHSSRMEGTISTLDEVLEFEADANEAKNGKPPRANQETMEVYAYSVAMNEAEQALRDGHEISEALIRAAHGTLLKYGRGAHLNPGNYKTEQNFLGDRSRNKASFVPISPEQLAPGMHNLLTHMRSESYTPLIRAAISHLEFEALHPFNDGNGRIGRMLITLYLWQQKQISAPHFYISSYFERYRDQYIDLMRNVSRGHQWTEWIMFFLKAVEQQSQENIQTVKNVQALYASMQFKFREILSSQYYLEALDFMFRQPVFYNNSFTSEAGIPRATAALFTRRLIDAELLITLRPAAGRRPALYMFEPLVSLSRV